jgi:alanyl-tRNA synthetase
MFLDFFKSKDHYIVNSYSLVPHGDNSLLLINAGMAPLKTYFTGQEIPPNKRMATCQKCIRTGDIENVGKTARHLTFFEMLGNFSFGDYFKRESLAWSWEFLTKVLGMDEQLLYPSIYGEDEEAYHIWINEIGVPAEKITRFYRDKDGKSDNFWEHGAGPCGPCSEIYYDRGEQYGCGQADCKVGCECDRFIEIWNNVFTQFEGDGKGNYTELATKNIDTGMGLERLAVVAQGVDTIFDIDTMKAIRGAVCQFALTTYQSNDNNDISIRLITDHIRSATFMISDGIMPSNEGRGYVLRRLIRRAARHGRLLGIKAQFLAKLSETVIQENKDGYPELGEKSELIIKVLNQEEEKFNKTIDQGLAILNQLQQNMEQEHKLILSGEEAFKLYDTYGFPMDLTQEILAEKGFTVDEAAFLACMEQQRNKARKARKETNYMGADATVYDEIDPKLTSEFTGYDQLEQESELILLTTESELTQALTDGQAGSMLIKETPFYATMGGQKGDTGVISCGEAVFVVEDTIQLKGGRIVHVGKVTKGMFQVGNTVHLSVDQGRRALICRNHSATHLLQKALREVLGAHVEQHGSDVNAKRLRFDFSHFAAMTTAEIKKVEEIVNQKIGSAMPVTTRNMTLAAAKETGAMALFGEKYGDLVRVVRMGEFSVELCGGTHVSNTSSITAFKIISEAGIAAGVRRIEAITSNAVFTYYNKLEETLHQTAQTLKTTPPMVTEKVTALLADMKALRSENEALKSKAAKEALGDVMDRVVEIKGIKLLAVSVTGVDRNGLRELGDQLKETLAEGVIVLASDQGGIVNLIAMVTPAAMKRGAHAGNLIKAIAGIVGGGGGGRPNMAQAGGNDPGGIPEAISTVKQVLMGQVIK